MEEKWRVVIGVAFFLLMMYFFIWSKASSTREDWENYRFHTIETRLWGLSSGRWVCGFFLAMCLAGCGFFIWMFLKAGWFWPWIPWAVGVVAMLLPVAYFVRFHFWVRSQLKPWRECEKRLKG
jgi:small-conductance mechanosensitive channel